MDSEGSVDNQPATIAYDRNDGTGLKWKRPGQAEWTQFALTDIIAVQSDSSTDEALLLLAAPNPAASDGAKVSPVYLKTVSTRGLPQPFVDDFRIKQPLSRWRADGSSHSQRDLHVVVSTGSGTGLAIDVWRTLVRPLLERFGLQENDDYCVHLTTSEMTVAEVTQNIIFARANAGAAQLVILLSGDGGIVDMVNALVSNRRSATYRRPTIALLPLGTGNALANSSGITGDSTLGLRTLLRGTATALPLFRATFSPGARLVVDEGRGEKALPGWQHSDDPPVQHGAVVASWGLHASLVADSDTAEYRAFGAERFKMAAGAALFPPGGAPPHAYRGRVSVRRPGGGGEWCPIDRSEHGYVLATLVQQLEAGFSISPASRPLDGRLRLVHFGPLGGNEAMETMGAAYKGGQHVDDERVSYEEVDGLRVEFDEVDGRWRRVCIDGKIVRVEEGGWMEVVMGDGAVMEVLKGDV